MVAEPGRKSRGPLGTTTATRSSLVEDPGPEESASRVVAKSWKVKKRSFHLVILEGDTHIGKVKWVKSGRATKASLLAQGSRCGP